MEKKIIRSNEINGRSSKVNFQDKIIAKKGLDVLQRAVNTIKEN